MAETLSIALQLRLDEFLRDIKKVPELSAQEARDMATSFRRELTSIERSAKKTAAELTKTASAAKSIPGAIAPATSGLARFGEVARGLNASPVISQLESMGALFIGVGGNVSRVAMTFTTAVRPVATLGTIFGALTPQVKLAAVALGGATAAALAPLAAFAIYRSRLQSIAEAAREAHESLVESKSVFLTLIPPEALRDAEAYARTVDLIAEREAALTVARAADTAPTMLGLQLGVDRLQTSVYSGATAWGSYALSLVEVVYPSVERVKNAVLSLRNAVEDAGRATMLGPSLKDSGIEDFYKDLAVDAKELGEIERKAREWVESAAQSRAIAAQNASEALKEELKDIELVRAAYGQLAEGAEKRAVEGNKRMQEMKEAYQAGFAAMNAQAAADQAAQAQRTQDTIEQLGTMQNAFASFAEVAISSSDAIVAATEARVRAGEEVSADEKVAANRAANRARDFAAIQVLTSAAVAFAGMVANMSIYTGPGAIVAAGAAVAGMLAPLIPILQRPLPFPSFGTKEENPGTEQDFDLNGDGRVGPGERQAAYSDAYGAGNVGRGSSSRTNVVIGLDPSLRTLSITTDNRPGKSSRRAGGL
jgi:hypothetical protein